MGEPPGRVLKTLMALVDGKPACVIVPSDREASMKKLAAAFGGKSAQMMKPADAERASGYKVGGISPFGQMRKVRTAIERAIARARLRLSQRRPARTAGAAEPARCGLAPESGRRATRRVNRTRPAASNRTFLMHEALALIRSANAGHLLPQAGEGIAPLVPALPLAGEGGGRRPPGEGMLRPTFITAR